MKRISRLFTKTARAMVGLLTLFFTLNAAAAPLTLTFAWPQNVGPLNPHLYTPNQMFAQSMVYEPLVKYDAKGGVTPWLAQRWTISADGKTYLFTLRHNVRFSNNEPFTAQAVVANFQAILANRSRHAWLELANRIDSVEAVDEDHVKLHLKSAYYPTLQELALPRPFRFIAPSQFVAGGTRNGIKQPIGTGPWILKESQLGESDLFVRNPHYWGTEPTYQQIRVKVIPDPVSRAMALESGDVDLLYGIDGVVLPDTFERLKQQGQYHIRLSSPMQTEMIAINSQHPPLNDLAVRQAINRAVDKQTLVATLLHHTEQPAATLFARNVPYANFPLPPYHYDPSAAAQQLEQAGWHLERGQQWRTRQGQPLTLSLAYIGTDAVSKSLAEVIQGNLRHLGINLQLIAEEESSIYARQRNGQFDLIFNQSWGPPYDPHAFLSSMRAPSHADYQAQKGLPDKKIIDQEISQVLSSQNDSERQTLYKDILTRLHQDAVYLPLTYVPIMLIANRSLADFEFPPLSSDIPFEQMKPRSDVSP